MGLIILSLIANILITFTVALGIARDHPGMTEAYGSDTPARRILGCVYLAIGLVSLYALLQWIGGNGDITRTVAFTLFPLQIVYKLMTAIAVRVTHPVVIANLCVVALLGLTLIAA